MGLTNRDIAKRMADDFHVNVDQATVGRIRKRENERGTVKRNKIPGSGRRRKTTDRVDYTIKRLALSNRKQTIADLATSVEESTGQRLSKRTIRRRLLEFDISSYVCARKPLLSKANRKKRRNWATKYGEEEEEDVEFWKTVMWSDESRFNLVSDKPQRCLRMPHERLQPECLQTTAKFGGGGVMVWGVFSYEGVGELYWAKGSINTDHYLRILETNLMPSIEKLHPDGHYIFQQDNAPCHVSKRAKKWFVDQNLNVMIDWPPQSPDMNPIEHVWDYIGRKIQNERFFNHESLFLRIKHIWDNLPIDFLHRLVDSMPKRVKELKSKKGGVTSY